MSVSKHSSRLLSIEALRGGAAIFVLFQTFLLAFLPQTAGILPYIDNRNSLMGSPLLVFINGMAAVMMFFVISGYVLTLKGLQPKPINGIADAAAKRWLRLAPIVTLSVLLSYLMFHLELFHFEQAAKLSRSDWLRHFGYGELAQSYRPTLLEALWQGAIGTFLFGEKSLNTNLWIIKWELWGSLVVLGLALLLKWRWLFWLSWGGAATLLYWKAPILLPFLVGMIAASLGIHRWKLKWPSTFALLIGGLLLCGYWHPIKFYAWARWLPISDERRQVLILSLGAMALLFVFASQNPISKKLNGKISALMGQMSFPLFLVHFLVVASFSSWAFVLMGGGVVAIMAAAIVTVATCVPLVWVFFVFDRWWGSILSRWRLKLTR